jgi:hypothetical protein
MAVKITDALRVESHCFAIILYIHYCRLQFVHTPFLTRDKHDLILRLD